MAEILKPRTDKQKQVVCPYCGATVGYYETEVERHWIRMPRHGMFSWQPSIDARYIKCPSCGSTINLDIFEEAGE